MVCASGVLCHASNRRSSLPGVGVVAVLGCFIHSGTCLASSLLCVVSQQRGTAKNRSDNEAS
jgi:hypothetical protein